MGLKENFFIFVILSAFRHMFRFLESRSPASLALAVMYAACCIFFRIAVCAITCVALCTALASRRSNRRTMLVLMAAGAAGGVLVLGFIMPYVFGVPLETILSITEARTAKSNDTLGNGITWVISSLATVCGPFANFSRMAEYSMVHGAGCLLKGVTGFPLLWGVWRSLREMQWRYYSLAVYFFIHVLMLILAGVSLDMRYQLTLFPLTMPFTALALGRRRLPRAFAVYCLGLLLLTILYNGR